MAKEFTIPLGILIFGLTIYLMATNPLAKLGQVSGSPGGGSFPSQEMMKQYLQQGSQFSPPYGQSGIQQPGGTQR